MSIASPIPVLRSSSGTVLQFDDDALVLRRTTEELRIPLRAIRRIRSEGRAVAVELTAPAGTAPAVHHVDDVSEAAVTLFADAVNAALVTLTEEADTVDGSNLVTARALTESREERRKRRRKIWALAVGLFHFALALAVGIHGEWTLALAILLVGPSFGAGSIAFGAMGADSVYRQWYLPRNGITVEAGRVGNARVLGGSFGTYVYTDLHGVCRSVYAKSGAPTVQVAYHPDQPHVSIVRETRSSTAGDAALAVALLLFGLCVEGGVITVAIGAFLGMYPGY
ncbi:hypothetical protein OG625_37310 [Streptomyces sp. NBC_01351]|uniref:hypothetical protein n=1 Tax=Streptomyces sp. NBC_01351 TaxID=2903833 RepID=UPI002E30E5A3|nr:hypothetical protein [Streptomyces sp. NBC_01351]